MEILNSELVQLDTSKLKIDITQRPFTVEYAFQSPCPMTPEQIETMSLYATRMTDNGDIILSEERPSTINARVIVPERYTAIATVVNQTNCSVELYENATKEDVAIFTKCLHGALENVED